MIVDGGVVRGTASGVSVKEKILGQSRWIGRRLTVTTVARRVVGGTDIWKISSLQPECCGKVDFRGDY